MKNTIITFITWFVIIFTTTCYGKALYEQEKAVFKYINNDHKYFCELAESREASYEYLVYNECK